MSRTTQTATTLALVLAPSAALAHPGHGAGFAGGLLHPLLGADHVAAMVAVGLWAVRLGGAARFALPAAFVSAAAAGTTLPASSAVETAVAGTLLLLGIVLALPAGERRLASATLLVAACGLPHGAAHAAEFAIAAGGLAHQLGFLCSTALLHGAGLALGTAWPAAATDRWARVTGAAIAGLGGVLLA